MNPHNDLDDRSWFTGESASYEGAVVTSSPTHTTGDGVTHAVRVSPDTYNGSMEAEIPVTARGDTLIPEEGQRVFVVYRKNTEPLVVAQRYEEDGVEPPSFEPGERRIGHPASDSHVLLQPDGTIRIDGANGNTVELAANGDVIINSGSNNPITDVSTTTDADGHVTSVSTTTSDSIYLP
jgi:hypothetical protein